MIEALGSVFISAAYKDLYGFLLLIALLVFRPTGARSASASGGSVSRLIFVEGFPGAGSRRTAQFLARRFARGGGRVRWIYEGEVPNPLRSSAAGRRGSLVGAVRRSTRG